MKLMAIAALSMLTGVSSASAQALSGQEKADGWALLFDGTSLNGWTTSGDLGAWTIEPGKDGAVLTMARPGHGDWLRTTRMYRDFELLLDFDVEKGKNSGVGLRGSSVGDPAFTGMEIQVFGNQGDKPTITSCGSVYDAIAPTAMPLKDGGQWNTFRIKLVGDTIDIWLNGEQIQKDQKLDARGYTHKPETKNPLNARCPTGFISLQDHGDKVRFRNIRVRDLSPDKDPGGFEPIFNGKDTGGWGAWKTGSWAVEDGVLIGRGSAMIMSDATWKDVEVRAFVQSEAGARGSLGARCMMDDHAEVSHFSGVVGAISHHDTALNTGAVSTRGPFGKNPNDGAPVQAIEMMSRDKAWFDYRLRVEGGRVQTWVNGRLMADGPASIDHAGRVMLACDEGAIMFKDVQVRNLSKK